MKLMKNYLHHTKQPLFQTKEMFRMNTDTRLLGEFMKIKPNESVVDLGTNNGALLLYASNFKPKHLYGVEVLKPAADLATLNLVYNKLSNFTILNQSIDEVVLEKVDVVVTNPPYFPYQEDSNINANDYLKIARHEYLVDLDKWLEVTNKLLKNSGRLYMVHRASRLSEIMLLCNKYNLGIKTIQFIHHGKRESASGVLIEAIKGQSAKIDVLKSIEL